MARKTAKDYYKDYSKVTAKLSSLESTIEKRAEQLAKKQPDVMFDEDETVKDIMDNIWNRDREDRVYTCIDVIRRIEEHNLKTAGITEQKLF